jgi:hypothetical protein
MRMADNDPGCLTICCGGRQEPLAYRTVGPEGDTPVFYAHGCLSGNGARARDWPDEGGSVWAESLQQVAILEVGLLQSTLEQRHFLVLFLEWIVTADPEVQQIP